jgi:hypothetical protein
MRLIASVFVIAFAFVPLASAEQSIHEIQVKSAPEQRSMTSDGSTLDSIKTAAVLGAIFIGLIMADDLWAWLEYPHIDER